MLRSTRRRRAAMILSAIGLGISVRHRHTRCVLIRCRRLGQDIGIKSPTRLGIQHKRRIGGRFGSRRDKHRLQRGNVSLFQLVLGHESRIPDRTHVRRCGGGGCDGRRVVGIPIYSTQRTTPFVINAQQFRHNDIPWDSMSQLSRRRF